MHDVIVDEERLRDQYLKLHTRMTRLEARYKRYLNILRRMRLSVIVSGESARALSDFTNRASKLEGQFDNLANDFEELSASFIREIDRVDDL